MPIGAIAIVAIMLVAMTGVTQHGKLTAALSDALSGFSNQLIWLIGISIMLSQSLLKTGWARALAMDLLPCLANGRWVLHGR